jgi:hypothetical protein
MAGHLYRALPSREFSEVLRAIEELRTYLSSFARGRAVRVLERSYAARLRS